MLSGQAPFTGRSEREIMRKVIQGNVTFKGSLLEWVIDEIWETVSLDAIKFIKRLLTYNVKQRPTAEEALNDIWILKHETYEINSYMLNIITNLKEFKNTSLIQKVILAYIAKHVMIKERQEKLREIFNILDTNNDGVISKDELVIGLKILNNGNEELAKEDSEVIMNNIDINKNGTIDYNGNLNFLY